MKICHAFEPDPVSLNILRKYLAENNISNKVKVDPYALSAENRKITFTTNGMVSRETSDGNITIETRIFDKLPDIDLSGDILIKINTEGAEMDVLHSMQNTIRKYKPYMAVCVYQKEEELFEVPDYLRSLCNDYRFYLRGGWHLECWAIPDRHFR